MNNMNLGFWHLLLERDFLVTMFAAIAAFATIVTLGLPYMKTDALETRLVQKAYNNLMRLMVEA